MKTKFLVCVVLFLLAAGSTWAQAAAGVAGISGVVHDGSGAAVPSAKIVISSDARGEVRSITTNNAGLFAAPALIPGPGYKVTVTASGFAAWEVKDIDLRVGQDLTLTANLSIAQSATQVEVQGAAPLVDSTKTDVSQVVGTREIMDLPINGRRVDSFVLNTPGVTNDATFGLLTFRGVAGNNSFLLDGNDNTEQFYDENAGRTRIQSQISADAVQEFQVVSANFSAEYGRAMGGVVNTVTKSGSNDIHGSAFLLSAQHRLRRPRSLSPPSTPPSTAIQTGGTVGGAIIKNKLFYFLSTDITRRNFPFVDSQVKVGFLDPVNQVWVGCAAPATPAQCAAINGLLPRFYGQIPRTAKNDLYFGRLDYHLNDKQHVQRQLQFPALDVAERHPDRSFLHHRRGHHRQRRRLGGRAQRESHLDLRPERPLGELLPLRPRYGPPGGQLRSGRTRRRPRLSRRLGGRRPAWTSDLSAARRAARSPQRIRRRRELGQGQAHDQVRVSPSSMCSDNVNYLSNRYGSYTYPTVTSFAQDYTRQHRRPHNYSAFTQTFGNPVVNYAIKDVGFYLQDQWKLTDQLTITSACGTSIPSRRRRRPPIRSSR